MAVEIRVPALGESIVDGTIAVWLKQEGEAVKQGEALLELETDKINVEVTAEQDGVLQKRLKNEGDNVAVGEVVGMLEAKAGAAQTAPAQAPAATAPAPALSNGPQPPAPSPVPTPAWGAPNAGQPQTVATPAHPIPPTPLARRVAEEHQVDLGQIRGTSPAGRVTKDDVLNYLEKSEVKSQKSEDGQEAAVEAHPIPKPANEALRAAAPGAAQNLEATRAQAEVARPQPAPVEASRAQPSVSAVTASPNGREERVRMTRRRQTIAQRLVEAQHNAAMLTTFNEIDMSAIMEVRNRRKDSFKERHGVSLGFMSFFTKAVVGALKTFPRLNAEIQGNEMVLKHYYDIGVAVGAEEGLVVPVVRDADRKSFAQIEQEIGNLAKKARDNTLTLAELQGGTFTITNGGVFGSLLSTPILNAPQVGILGMHKIEQRPVVVKGEIVIRPMMYVALSYDHRIVDGREAVQFLVRVKELLEDPEALLLEG